MNHMIKGIIRGTIIRGNMVVEKTWTEAGFSLFYIILKIYSRSP